MFKRKNNQGFSLVELLVVVAIVAVMGSIAIPAMFSWLENKGLQSAARDLYSNMRRAQSFAVKNNRNCAVSFDGTAPFKGSLGYTVYIDANKDFVNNAGELVIAQVVWSQYRNVQLVEDVNFDDTAASGKPTFAFQPNLIPTGKSGGVADGSSVKIKNSGQKQYEVAVSSSGNISLK